MAFVSREVLAALSVRISADAQPLTRGLSQARQNLNVFSQSAKMLGPIVAGAFSINAIKNFTQASLQAYDVQIQAEKGLLTALGGREDVQARLMRQASEIQSRTTFGDEDLIAQQKYLAALKLSEKQIRDTIEASIQLSAATGITLDSAVKNLAKTYGGLTGELGELLPQLKTLTADQLKSGEAISLVNRDFKGFAETAATEGLGAVKQLENAWGDVKEEFGKWSAPTLTEWAQDWKNELIVFQDDTLSTWEKVKTTLDKDKLAQYIEDYIEALKKQQEIDRQASEDSISNIEIKIPLLQQLNEQLSEQLKLQKTAVSKTQLAQANREIQLIQEKIKTLKELGRVVKEVPRPEEALKIEAPKIDISLPADQIPWFDADAVKTSVDNMKYFVNGLWLTADEYSKFQEEISKVNQLIESGLENMVAGFGEGLGQMIATGQGFDASMLLAPLADMAIQLGKLAIATGIAISGIKKAFVSHPAVAIAAGIALVALGSAVKSKLGSMGSMVGASVSMPTASASSSSNFDASSSRALGERSFQNETKISGNIKLSGSDLLIAFKRAEDDKNIRT